MNENLIPNAGVYAHRHQLELAETLGSGKDGIVLAAKSKNRPEQFGTRWPDVRRVLDVFEEFGVYLLDVSPSNIAFAD